MSTIRVTDTIGQLVAQRPSRARAFERLGIDYCCGGKLTVAEAAAQKKLDAQAVIAAVRASDAAAPADERDWTQAPLAELADHIEQTHHAYLRRELPRLTGLVAKIRQVHGERHPELSDVEQTFSALRAELESHMRKEEMILFPIIRDMESTRSAGATHCGSVQNPIRVMEMEHESAGQALEELRRLTGDYTAPADGCNTYVAALAGLAEVERDLHEHIHKENNVLFPRAVALESECLAMAN